CSSDLARYAIGKNGGAAQTVLFDHGDVRTLACRHQRRLITTGSAADNRNMCHGAIVSSAVAVHVCPDIAAFRYEARAGRRWIYYSLSDSKCRKLTRSEERRVGEQ